MASTSSAAQEGSKPPVAIVCIGMAGSGKTTFMQRINSHLHTLAVKSPSTHTAPYVLNLDPAVRSVPFESNIDIRDSVNYKEVMKQYNLGPNGGILTSLNLFTTKIDQVMGILEKRCLSQAQQASPTPPSTAIPATPPRPQHILIDTPGQIEVFVWSASGSILLSALASSFPTVLAYVIDTPRTAANTNTFMANMLYAVSILYKTKLPMILVFNKTDVQDADEAIEWMRDFEAFQAALRKEEENESVGGDGGGGYMHSLLNSMSLVLEEFYNQLSVVGVSSMTGQGVDEFFAAVEEKKAEFERDYRPEMEKRVKEAEQQREELRQKEVQRMMRDMGVSSRAKGTGKYAKKQKDEPETVSDAEDAEAEAEEEDDASGMVDPDGSDEDAMDEEEDGFGAGFEEGLKKRYQRALKETGDGSAGAVGKAANYIRGSQR